MLCSVKLRVCQMLDVLVFAARHRLTSYLLTYPLLTCYSTTYTKVCQNWPVSCQVMAK